MGQATIRENQYRAIQQTSAEMIQIRQALQEYYREVGMFPVVAGDPSQPSLGQQGLAALVAFPLEAPILAEGVWNGPYLSLRLKQLTHDAWGNLYEYRLEKGCPASCTAMTSADPDLINLNVEQVAVLISYGPDQQSGTEDDIEVKAGSGSLSQALIQDLERKLKSVQNTVQGAIDRNPGSTLIGDLIAESEPNPPTCSLDRAQEISKYVFPMTGLYFLTDPWGNTILWHDQTGKFYSVGPDRIDQTCDQASIDSRDFALSSATTENSLTLPAPQSVSATSINSTTVHVAWNAVSGASSYRLFHASDCTLFTEINSLNGDSYDHGGLSCGSRHCYQVRAVNSFSDKAASTSPVVETVTPIPVPQGLQATALDVSRIELLWQSTCGATGYTVHWGTDPIDLSQSEETTSTQITVGGLQPGVTYYFRVQAFNSLTQSDFSSQVSATTVVGSPSGLTATLQSPDAILVQWNPVSGASEYRLYRSTDNLNFVYYSVLATEYLNTPVEPLYTYYYRVSSLTNGVESEPSETVQITVPLEAPENLTYEVLTATSARISWQATANTEHRLTRGNTFIYQGMQEEMVISGLEQGQTYEFAVQPMYQGGGGEIATLVLEMTPPPIRLCHLGIYQGYRSIRFYGEPFPGPHQFNVSREHDDPFYGLRTVQTNTFSSFPFDFRVEGDHANDLDHMAFTYAEYDTINGKYDRALSLVSADIEPECYAAPTYLTLTDQGDGWLRLDTSDIGAAVSYRVYSSTDNWQTYQEITTLPKSTSFEVIGLNEGQTYDLRLKSVFSDGTESTDFSPNVTGTAICPTHLYTVGVTLFQDRIGVHSSFGTEHVIARVHNYTCTSRLCFIFLETGNQEISNGIKHGTTECLNIRGYHCVDSHCLMICEGRALWANGCQSETWETTDNFVNWFCTSSFCRACTAERCEDF